MQPSRESVETLHLGIVSVKRHVACPFRAPFAPRFSFVRLRFWASRQCNLAVMWQVDVVFEEVDEMVLQDSELPFIAGRLAEPVQPNLLRMRELLAASKCNVVLIDGVDQVSASLLIMFP